MSRRVFEVVVVDGTGVVFHGPVQFETRAEASKAAAALTCVKGEVREVERRLYPSMGVRR